MSSEFICRSDGPELKRALKERTAELRKNLVAQAIQDRVGNSVIAIHEQITRQTADLGMTHSAADVLLELDNRTSLELKYSHRLAEIVMEIFKEQHRLDIARKHEKEHANRLTDVFDDIYAIKFTLSELLFPCYKNNCDWIARAVMSVEDILSSTLSYLH